MPIIRLHNDQGNRNVFYEFNSDDQPLGEGGMGRVFKGRRIDRNNGLVRDVAIKMMFDDLPDHVIERARREASIRIVNDNLVEMIDFVEVNERNAYGQVVATHYHVVSEYLDGVNLDEFLKGKTANHDGRPNPTAEQLYEEYQNDRPKFVGFVFKHILLGITALHYAGYIHRDIDPSNIMVTSDGKIKLIDFGIAREVASMGQQDHHLTNTGQFIGKPYYAAPELVLGDIAHQDFRTDIYALGIMLFQLTTGHLPFDGPMLEVNEKQLNEKLPLKEVNDKTVRKIIAKATEKKQEKRYLTAAEMLVDIDRWLMEKPVSSKDKKQPKPKRPIEEKQPKPKKEKQSKLGVGNKSKLFLGIAAGVALLVGVGVLLKQNMSDKPGQEKVHKEQIAATPPKSVFEAPPVKEVKTTNKAISLMMDRNTASEGLSMLNDLVKEGNYDATFLKSRIYFDPSGNSKDKLFYDEDWAKMRQNCGITTDNTEAHLLLLKAFNINDNDYVSLYQLGCDFMSGQRGCERNTKYAAWCFNKASSLLETSNSIEVEQYRQEIKSKLERLKSVKAERPNSIAVEMPVEGQDQKLNLELDLDKVSSSNKQDDNWKISNF